MEDCISVILIDEVDHELDLYPCTTKGVCHGRHRKQLHAVDFLVVHSEPTSSARQFVGNMKVALLLRTQVLTTRQKQWNLV
jgi:hypothetical protein